MSVNKYVSLQYVSLQYVSLKYVSLKHVSLKYVSLKYVSLKYVNLKYVSLKYELVKFLFSVYVCLHCYPRHIDEGRSYLHLFHLEVLVIVYIKER